jgi:GNAT superfamily N-acetyltransferase
VQDTPGQLAQLTTAVAALGGNIRTVQVHPTPDGAVDEVLLHMPGNVSERALVRAVVDAGARDVSVQRADVRELDDVPTRVLTLATELINGQGELVRVLRRMLGRVEVRWQEQPDPPLEVDGLADDAMCLAAPGGGVLVLRRRGGSFTPAEFARARSMTELALACRTRSRDAAEEIVVAGTVLTVRPADRDDTAAVADFHDRCTASSRYRRYGSPGPSAGSRGLLRLLTPALGRTLLVLDAGGSVVAMGNVMYDGDDGELGLLVRDDWQRRGLGSQLASRLVAEADVQGLASITAQTHMDNTAVARVLQGAGLRLVGAPEPGEWTWSRRCTRSAAPVRTV